MALALNNLKRVYMPLNKETKPNQNLIFYRKTYYGIWRGVMVSKLDYQTIVSELF